MIYLYSLYNAGILLMPVLVILAAVQEYLERKGFFKYFNGRLSRIIKTLGLINIGLVTTIGASISLIEVLTTQYSNILLIFTIAAILMLVITFGRLIYYSLNGRE